MIGGNNMSATTKTKKNSGLALLIKLIVGPIAYFMVSGATVSGLTPEAMQVLGVYAWLVLWWCLQPIPWGGTSMLPLVILPIVGVYSMKEVIATVYAQQIMYLLIFVFILGKVIERSGIGKRIATTLLSLKWINGSVARFGLVYMLTTAVVCSVFAMAAGLMVAVPIGVAVIDHIVSEYEKQGKAINKVKLGSYVMLCAGYGSIGGCTMFLHSIPHTALVLGIMESTVNLTSSYVQWMGISVIIALIFMAISYIVLNILYKVKDMTIPGGQEYFEQVKKEIGPMGKNEKIFGMVMLGIIALWILTSFVSIKNFDFYWVAAFGLVMLYVIPLDIETDQRLATPKDICTINWNIIFLITSAVGYSTLLQKVGVIEYIATQLQGVDGMILVFISSFATPVVTNFLPGMATATTMATLMFPIISGTAIHPMVLAKIIPATAIGMMTPWAGTTAALVYASQKLDFKEMVKTGVVMVVVLGTVFLVGSMVLVPILQPYTAI